MKLKTALAPIVAIFSLAFVASDASAYYASHMGRWLTRDPMGYRGGMDLYEFVGSCPTTWLDPLGWFPMGKPGGWGSGDDSTGNCWRYACNDPGKPREPHSPFPGGPDPGGTISCMDLMRDVRHMPGVTSPSPDGECDECDYKVLLVLTPPDDEGFNDYHWYRQDDDGSWSSKPGNTPVVPVEPGTPPEDDARKRGYPTICGYLCVSDRGVDLDNPNPGPDLDEIIDRPGPPTRFPTPHGNPRRGEFPSD
jgi:hypothetical protein